MAQLPSSVLVAVDFGDASARAIAVAGFVADRCRIATVRLLHADTAEAPAYFTSEQVERLERQQHALRIQADQFLTRFGRQHTKVPFTTMIRNGPAVDAILQEASSAELVIMGTHGRRGPKRWWLGSVAERILREIRRPLLIVRADSPRDDGDCFARTVVQAAAPLDRGPTLAFARALAGCVGGEVIDNGGRAFDPARLDPAATLAVVAVPDPKTPAWLSQVGEPLVRSSAIPILFVPELERGAAL
jgi:nucleotide-binding universal stress UspA family protein